MAWQHPLRIALVAGEDSGDVLGADLAQALRARLGAVELAGIAGPRMQAAGVETWYDMRQLSVMGLVEVLRHLPRLLRLRRSLLLRLRAWQPDVYVGIDAPDFNLGVERTLKLQGIRTVHYVSPSIWAWREKRAAKIGRAADRVLCLFPMEPPIYAHYGVDARFVGHPLADRYSLEPDRAAARARLGLDDTATVLALLPGSRLSEVARLGAIFVDAAARVATHVPGLRVVAPMANPACRVAFAPLAQQAPRGLIELHDGHTQDILIASDIALLASGTAALEAMLAHRAMVVAYRIHPLTYWLVRNLGLMRTERYALPNILAGDELVPEMMQEHCAPEALAAKLLNLLHAHDAHAPRIARMRAIHTELRRDASHNAADAIAELLAERAR
jgi:lipid-A-disaccharide synthase